MLHLPRTYLDVIPTGRDVREGRFRRTLYGLLRRAGAYSLTGGPHTATVRCVTRRRRISARRTAWWATATTTLGGRHSAPLYLVAGIWRRSTLLPGWRARLHPCAPPLPHLLQPLHLLLPALLPLQGGRRGIKLSPAWPHCHTALTATVGTFLGGGEVGSCGWRMEWEGGRVSVGGFAPIL